MILIMKILLHNVYKIINWWYPTYVYQFFNFPYNYKNRVLACFQTRPEKTIMVLLRYIINYSATKLHPTGRRANKLHHFTMTTAESCTYFTTS